MMHFLAQRRYRVRDATRNMTLPETCYKNRLLLPFWDLYWLIYVAYGPVEQHGTCVTCFFTAKHTESGVTSQQFQGGEECSHTLRAPVETKRS